MKPKLLTSILTTALLASPLTAATFTWDGGSMVDANSATAENWVDDLPLTSNPDIIFGLAGTSGTAITWGSGNISSMTFASTASAYTLSNAGGFQFIKAGVDAIANNSLNTQTFSSNVRVFFNGAKAFNANTANLSLSSVTFRADSMTVGQINTLVLTGAKDGTISGAIDTAGTFTNLATGFRNAVTKTGTGTWTLAGANTYGGLTQVQNGTLTLSGNRTTAMASGITLGGGGAVSQTLNLQNGNFSLGGSYTIGNGGSTAIVNHTGGTISGVAGSGILLGNGNGASTYNLSAGALTGNMIMGVNTATVGTNVNNFNLSGTGSFTSGNLQVGRTGTAGSFNTDNTFTQTGGTATITTLGLGGSATDTASTSPIAAKLDLTAGVFTAITFASLSAGGANTSVITIGGTADVTLGAFPTARGSGSTATITFDGGTLKPAAASAAYMGGLTNAFLTANGAKFDVATGKDITVSQVLENAASQVGTLTKLGAGVLTLTGTNSYTGTTTISAGTLRIGAGALTGTLGGGGVTNNSVLEFNRSNAMTVTNAISGTGTIYQKGSGTTTLDPGAGTNTIRAISADGGNLTLKSGTFETTGVDPFNAAYNVGAGARGGTLTIDGATLNIGASKALKVGAAANGNLEIKSGTVTANDLVLGHNGISVGTQSGGDVTVTNLYHQDGGNGSSYTLSGGSLTANRIYNSTALANDFTLNLNGGTLYSASGTTNLIDNDGVTGSDITVLLGTGNTTIDTTNSSATIVRAMGDMPSVAGGFTKDGSNNLTLSGDSTYTGITTVSAGTLLINGDNSAATGAVNVGSVATLGGGGTFGGALTISSGATLAPGAANSTAGNLNAAADVTLAGIYQWDLATLSTTEAGTNFDTVTLTAGNANITGASLLLNLGGNEPSAVPFWQTNQTWAGILNNTGFGSLTGAFTITNDQSSWSSLGSFTTTTLGGGNDVNLVWSAVPEPSNIALVGGLGLLGILRRRRDPSIR